MRITHTSVLVVGGGLVGLSTAMFLGGHGVDTVLIERRSGTSIHPRARGFNPRTMELFRSAGIESRIQTVSEKFEHHLMRGKVESLTGRELYRSDLPATEDLSAVSPTQWCLSDQDRIEPVVRERAEELDAQLRFDTELVSFAQDEAGVTALVRNRKSGTDERIRASYLVAADGARSEIRRMLDIDQRGPGTLKHQVSVLFRADLRPALGDRRFAICQVQNPEVQGVLAHDDSLQRGTLIVSYQPEQGESATDFSTEKCRELIRAAIGDRESNPEILQILPWDMAALAAERYRVGRVFLAGDAVHVVPPVGGFGASTGIQDAHNLAWKLAFVTRDGSPEDLLATYEAERKPVGDLTVDQCYRRLVSGAQFNPANNTELVSDMALTFGYRYRSDAVLAGSGINSTPPLAQPPEESNGDPGTRAPHIVLRRKNEDCHISTLDLFHNNFTLLTGSDGYRWTEAASRASGPLNQDILAYCIGAGGDFVNVEDGWAILNC